MGASIGMAGGAERAQGKAFSRGTVAVLGDSTFIHSGLTSLIDAVYNREPITVAVSYTHLPDQLRGAALRYRPGERPWQRHHGGKPGVRGNPCWKLPCCQGDVYKRQV